jgi:uncharacterized caspase-like protein
MGRRVALLIGNGTFLPDSGLDNLRGPVNDVERLAAVLGDPERGNFEVRTFLDRPGSEVFPAIEDVVNDATRDDLVLIFYAGHGKLDGGGRLCLAMAETQTRRVFSTSISASGLTNLLGNGGAGAIVLLLDCCYSGAMSKEFHRGSATEELGALAREVSGLHVITATTGTQTAREREEEADGLYMGAFTRQIVEGLRSGTADRDGDGIVTLSDLERHLRETVRQQTPRRTSHDASGDPMIARALPQATADERRLERLGRWHNDGRLTVDAFNDLVGVLDGQDGEATKLQIERLLDDPKTGPKALLGVLRAWRLPAQSPPVRIPVREQAEARKAVEEPSVAPEAAPIVVAPPVRSPLLERIPPFVTGQVAGAVIMGSMAPLLNGAYFFYFHFYFWDLDWIVVWGGIVVGPIVSALVCWRWPGPGASAWRLLPVALLANPMMWLVLAASMGLAHLGTRATLLIILPGFLSVLAGLAWRSFKNRGAA